MASMARLAPILLLSLVFLAPGRLPADEPVDWEAVGRIRDEGFRRSKVMETVRHLTDEIGPRLTGSPQMKEANDWTRKTLEDWGLANARLESYPFGRSWSFTRTSVHLLKPHTIPLQALPKAWTPGTDGPVRGPVVHVEKLESEEDFTRHRGKLAGRIVLLGEEEDLADDEKEDEETYPRRYSDKDLQELGQYEIPADRQNDPGRWLERAKKRRAANQFLKEEKALAYLDPSSRGWGNLRVGRGGAIAADEDPGIPGLTLAAEQFNRLVRLAKAGREIEMEIDVQARLSDKGLDAYNTVAEIPGTDRKGEVVMVGAHLDSWHGGTGATDNAAGCAVAMEAVRILETLGVKPRRTIRIALWSGEEQGLLGSANYVSSHFGTWPLKDDPEQKRDLPFYRRERTGPFQPKPEHAKVSAYFNLDNGGGKIRGIYAQENSAVVPIFEAWLRPLRDLGADTVTLRNTGATDHVPFDAVGIPAFQFIQDELDYDSLTHHTYVDVYDHLEAEDLKQAAVVMASFLYHAAMRPEPLPRKPIAPLRGETGRSGR